MAPRQAECLPRPSGTRRPAGGICYLRSTSWLYRQPARRGREHPFKGPVIAAALCRSLTGFLWCNRWAAPAVTLHETRVRSGHLADRAAVTPTARSPRYFKDYLSRRWDAGCTNGGQLLHEIKRLGYTGCYSHLQRFLAGWRRANCQSSIRSEPPVEESRAIDPATGWQISWNAAASLCKTSSGVSTPTQAAKVQALSRRYRV